LATIVTRAGKGSPLTNAEADANFTNLNNGKVETSVGVVTTGSYANPSWITSLDGGKLTGTVVATNGVVTTGSYANPSWITSLAETKVLPSQATHTGKFLTTNGTATSWANVPAPNNGTLTLGVSGTGLSGSASFTADQAGNSTFTVTSNATNLNTASTLVARDASGNFSAGTITAALTGNASTATTLQTARTINGTSFNGSANITTTNWGTARTLNGVSVDGSTNYNIPDLRATNSTTTLSTVGVTSAVNFLQVTNAATGGAVQISTAGTDTNINLQVVTKGTGSIILDTGASTGDIELKPGSANLRLYDDDSSHYYQFITGNQTANYTLTLPAGNVVIPAGTLVPTTGTGASGTWGISVTGNAGTATTLQTARTINGVSFNGSANITVTANTPSSATFNNGGAGAASGATFNGGSAVTVSYNTVGAPSTTGTNASGTWGISITGNAATVTNGVYTSGTQTISGNKTFADTTLFQDANHYLALTSGNAIHNLDLNDYWNYARSTNTLTLVIGAATRLTVDGSGNLTASGNITSNSDARLKSDIFTIPDALAKVEALRGTSFVMNGKRQIGVIAQEIEQVVPEVVQENEDGYLSVAYGNIAAVLIEAVKELSAEVKTLKARLGEQ
jgi:trimeric autotransporter adhesin